ncbi:hypothetical protein [Chryseobacterium viscerum]|uniref:hypothetical protein n=1 Tax=Chryseobacterium viscerum TaxID=1037377 RepID=UPI0013867A64|nr:hypothetical protein [Chryseobacterium viscerum]
MKKQTQNQKLIDMKKIPKTTVKIAQFNESNVEVNVIISANTQFGDPHFIINGKWIEDNNLNDDKFSFTIPKADIESDKLLFATSFNTSMQMNHLQILINTCRIKFEFPQIPAKNFHFNPFEGKKIEDLSDRKSYPVYKFINVKL